MRTDPTSWLGRLLAVAFLLPATTFAQRSWPAPEDVATACHVGRASVQSLLPLATVDGYEVRIRLEGRSRVLVLSRHDVRAPGFELRVQDGSGVHRAATPPSVTFRGLVSGASSSRVAATVVDGAVRAVFEADGTLWGIQPLGDAVSGAPVDLHVVYRAADVQAMPFRCGNQAAPVPAPIRHPSATSRGGANAIAELAIDADEPYYRALGSSVTAVNNDVTGVINAVDVIYGNDVQISHTITAIVVRTTPFYTNTDPSALLGEMATEWNTTQAAVPRDMAHLFTDTPRGSGVIGVAYLGVVCSLSRAYGLSWTLFSSNLTSRVGLTAHELGHNWGASHCDGLSPCQIMCSVLGGCSGNVTGFCPTSIATIQQFTRTVVCLGNNPITPPTLTSVTPASVNAYQPAQMTVTGTDLDNVTQVTVDGAPVTFTVVDPTTLQVNATSALTIASHSIVAINPGGSSNGLPFSATASHPSLLVVGGLLFKGVPLPITVHTDVGWTAVLLVSASSQVSSFPAVVQLGLGANFTQVVPVGTLAADAGGVATFSITIPTTAASVPLYWQAVTFDPAQTKLPLETSNLRSSVVF